MNEVINWFDDMDNNQKDFTWQEFTLKELGLPSAEKILKGAKEIETKVGLIGWREKNYTSETYKGFGLTYNPTFFDKNESIYHQVFGSRLLTQSYGLVDGMGDHKNVKDNYYDSFGFRKIDGLIQKHLGFLLDRFSFPISRSRVAYVFGYGSKPTDKGWHIDEPASQVLRVNIPLQTSNGYAIEFQNKYYELEVGKVYLWNTRLPHRVKITKEIKDKQPRINLILGLVPWLNYDKEKDSFSKNEYFGKSINEMVKEKLWILKEKNFTRI